MSDPEISRQELSSQPVLFVRRRTAQADLAKAIGECLPPVYNHCQQAGLTMAGPPFVRYVDVGPGLWTIEGGIPLVEPAQGQGEITAGALPGGPVATAVHVGPYDTLGHTHAAIERWIEDNGHRPGGAPWEVYLTDPGEEPDPAKWRTRVVWPLGS